jgi:hypothetical protein
MVPEPHPSSRLDKHHLLAIVGVVIAAVSLIATLIASLAPSETRHVVCKHMGIFCPVSVERIQFFAYDEIDILDVSLGIPPHPELRMYDPRNRFARNSIRAIYWETDIRFPKSQAQITIEVEGTKYSPSMVPGKAFLTDPPAATPSTTHVIMRSTPGSTKLQIVGLAADIVDALPPGRYHVEIFVEANQTSQRFDATFELY